MMRLPEWDALVEEIAGIFERRYFANNGPLVRQLDEEFARQIGSAFAVSVVSDTVAAMIVFKALCFGGDIAVPCDSPPAILAGLEWGGFGSITYANDIIDDVVSRVSGVLAIHRPEDPRSANTLAKRAAKGGVPVIFWGTPMLSEMCHGRPVECMGLAAIYSFSSDGPIQGADGACITTTSEDIARKIRTMRNFHASETFADVPLRINGKMSEAQAALLLLQLRRVTKPLRPH